MSINNYKVIFTYFIFVFVSNYLFADEECAPVGAYGVPNVVVCNDPLYNDGITYEIDGISINQWFGSEAEFINLNASGDLAVTNNGVVSNQGSGNGININSSGIDALGQGVFVNSAEDGGNVTVIHAFWPNDSFIETQADAADAIHAESNGGSTKGIDYADSGDGGLVEVYVAGFITTNGNDAYGVYAASNGGDAISDGILRNAGDGGDVKVEATVAPIITYGNGSHGVYVASNGGSVYSNDVKNQAGNGGNVKVHNANNINTNGVGANGIHAISLGGEVTAPGMFGDGDGGDIKIVNTYNIVSEQGSSIYAHSGSDGFGNGGDVIVENSGLLYGSINLSSEGSEGEHVVLNNTTNSQYGGVIEIANGDVNMQGNGILFENQRGAEIRNIHGDYSININDLTGDHGYFNNYGVINMQNNEPNNTLTVNSPYINFGRFSSLYLDVNNASSTSSDLLVLNGDSVVGSSQVFFDFNGFSSMNPVDEIKVVDVNSNINSLILAQGNYLSIQGFEYNLVEGSVISADAGDWYLNKLQPARNLYGMFGISNSSSNIISAFNNIGGGITNGFAFGNKVRFWSRGFGSKSSNTGRYANDSTIVVMQFGADLNISDSLKLSLTGGKAASSVDRYYLSSLESEVEAKMAGIGIEYKVGNTPLNIDASLSYGKIKAKNYVNEKFSYINDEFKGNAIAARAGIGYSINRDSYSIEPRAAISHTNVDFDDKVDSTGAHISILNGDRTEFVTSVRLEDQSIKGVVAYIEPKIAKISGGDYTLQTGHFELSEEGDNYSYGANAGVTLNLSDLITDTIKLNGATSFDVVYDKGDNKQNISASANVEFRF